MTTRIIALCGSLRRGSRNRQLLNAAQAIATRLDARIDIADIGDLPLYNGDIEADGMPAAVSSLGERMLAADAVLIASPEYNYSIPGVLKNAIDWLSRLSPQPFSGKPVAIMGTSPGAIGTGRMQYHLRQVLVCLDARTLTKPEVMIGSYSDKFDDSGTLTDSKALEMIERLLTSLLAWQKQLA